MGQYRADLPNLPSLHRDGPPMSGSRSAVTNALVPIPTEASREYARLTLEVESRKRVISGLQAERDTLERALTRFAVDLKSRVGTLRMDLNRVRLQLAEYKRRIERLKGNDGLDPDTLEREVAEEFAAEHEERDAEEEASARAGQRVEGRRTSPRLDPETEAEILRLYRELAKRVHPDLARTDRERARRTELMLKINVAYSERDLLTLQTIARQAEAGEGGATVLTPEDRVAWARRSIDRLDVQIDELRAQLDLLMASETYQMWHSPQQSAESLQQVERRVRDRLNRERDRLDEAIIDYNRMVRRRRMSAFAGQPRPTAAPAAGQ